MFCVAGFGGVPNPSEAQINMVVASTIMFGLAFGMTWAPAPYTTAAETSSNAVSRLVSVCPSTADAAASRKDHVDGRCRAVALWMGRLVCVSWNWQQARYADT